MRYRALLLKIKAEVLRLRERHAQAKKGQLGADIDRITEPHGQFAKDDLSPYDTFRMLQFVIPS